MANKSAPINYFAGIIGFILWIIILILGIMAHVRLGEEDYSYGNYFGLNWAQGPVKNLESENQQTCPIGSSYGLVQSYFPGFKKGCYCSPNNYYSGDCTKVQLNQGCKQFPDSSPKLLVSWGGTLCVERPKNQTYFSLNTTNSNPNVNQSKCSNNTKSCGIANSLGEQLCVSTNETCPINYIQVVNKNSTSNSDEEIKQRGFQVKKVSFASGNKMFIYSNENNSGKILNQFLISDHKPCADSAENKIELSPDENEYECKRSINGYTYNPEYTLLDTMTIEELLKDNRLNSQIEQYPFYNSIKNKKVGLYYRNYIGLNSACIQEAKNFLFPLSLNVIPQTFLNLKKTVASSNIDFISVPSITLYSLIFIVIIMKIMLAYNSKYSHRLYINISAAFLLILLLIIGIISTINISDARNSYIWFYDEPKCSDSISQGILSLFDSKIREAYVMAIIFDVLTLILFFLMILEYLIYHSYDDEEAEEENKGNENKENDSDSSHLLSNDDKNNNNKKPAKIQENKGDEREIEMSKKEGNALDF